MPAHRRGAAPSEGGDAHPVCDRPAATVSSTRPLQAAAEQPRVRRARSEAVLAHLPAHLGAEQDEVCGRTDRDPRPLEAEDPRRAGRHPLEQRLQRDEARLDERGVERGERGLEAGDAERRLLEGDVLLLTRVRRMVGGDRLERPVDERLDQRRRGRRPSAAAGSSSGSGRASGPPRRSGRGGAASPLRSPPPRARARSAAARSTRAPTGASGGAAGRCRRRARARGRRRGSRRARASHRGRARPRRRPCACARHG